MSLANSPHCANKTNSTRYVANYKATVSGPRDLEIVRLVLQDQFQWEKK